MESERGDVLFDEQLVLDEVAIEEMATAAARPVVDEQSKQCRFSLALYDPGVHLKSTEGTRAIALLCSFGPGEDRTVAEGQVKLWFDYAPPIGEKPIVVEIWPQEKKSDADFTQTFKASGEASGKVMDVVSLKGALASEQTVKFSPIVVRGFGQGGAWAQWEFHEVKQVAAGLASGSYLLVVIAAPSFRALSLEAEVSVTTRPRNWFAGMAEALVPLRLGRRGQRKTVILPPAP
jgi:hypothetical protein